MEAGSLNEVVHAAFATASLAVMLLGYSVQLFLKYLGQFSTTDLSMNIKTENECAKKSNLPFVNHFDAHIFLNIRQAKE